MTKYKTKVVRYETPNYREVDIYHHGRRIVHIGSHFIILQNHGYFSKSTKKRMNEAAMDFLLPYHIWQQDFEWYVEWYDNITKFPPGGGVVLDRDTGEVRCL